MRYIWLIRHGKSRDASMAGSDHERVLAERGERDGATMQAFYAAHSRPAEWVWASSAARAQLTAEFVALGFTATITTAPELYLSSPEAALDVLRTTPTTVQSVAVVAHNPGLTYLANLLGAEPVTDNLVTFGSVLFATEVEWSSLAFHHNHFMSITTPKSLQQAS